MKLLCLCALFPSCPTKVVMVLGFEVIYLCLTLRRGLNRSEQCQDVFSLCKVPLSKLCIFNDMHSFGATFQ